MDLSVSGAAGRTKYGEGPAASNTSNRVSALRAMPDCG
jgi:hypothetical protein